MTRAPDEPALDRRPRRLAADEEGQISFLVVLAMFALTPLLGLIMNVSSVVRTKTRVQEAADAAAIASAGAGARGLNFIANGNIALFELTAFIVLVDGLDYALDPAKLDPILTAWDVAASALTASVFPPTVVAGVVLKGKLVQERVTLGLYRGALAALKGMRRVAIPLRRTIALAQKGVGTALPGIVWLAGYAAATSAAPELDVFALPLFLPKKLVQETTMDYFEKSSPFMSSAPPEPPEAIDPDAYAEQQDEQARRRHEEAVRKLANERMEARTPALEAEVARRMAQDPSQDEGTVRDQVFGDARREETDRADRELKDKAQDAAKSGSGLEGYESDPGGPSAVELTPPAGGRPSQEFNKLYIPTVLLLTLTVTLSGAPVFFALDAPSRFKAQLRGMAYGTKPRTPAPPKATRLMDRYRKPDQKTVDSYFRHTWYVSCDKPERVLPGVFGEDSSDDLGIAKPSLEGWGLVPRWEGKAHAFAESIFFNAERWDLVTPRWEAALVPVQRIPSLPSPARIQH